MYMTHRYPKKNRQIIFSLIAKISLDKGYSSEYTPYIETTTERFKMKVKTGDLTGATLDWAVAKCEGWVDDCSLCSWLYQATLEEVEDGSYKPSTDWAQGGAIIERNYIDIFTEKPKDISWIASIPRYQCGTKLVGWRTHQYGSTPLEAAMRCYVASKLGEEVDIPDNIQKSS